MSRIIFVLFIYFYCGLDAVPGLIYAVFLSQCLTMEVAVTAFSTLSESFGIERGRRRRQRQQLPATGEGIIWRRIRHKQRQSKPLFAEKQNNDNKSFRNFFSGSDKIEDNMSEKDSSSREKKFGGFFSGSDRTEDNKSEKDSSSREQKFGGFFSGSDQKEDNKSEKDSSSREQKFGGFFSGSDQIEDKSEKDSSSREQKFGGFFSGSDKKEDNKSEKDSSSKEQKFGGFFSGSNKKEDEKQRSEKEKTTKEGGIFRAITKRFSSSNEDEEDDKPSRINRDKKQMTDNNAKMNSSRSDQKTRKKGNEDEKTNNSKNTDRSPLGSVQKFVSNVFGNEDKEKWIFVCKKTILAPGQIVPVSAAGLDLLVVASKDGRKLHCIPNSCPHLGTPLETGALERRPIEPSSSNNKSFNKNRSTETTSLIQPKQKPKEQIFKESDVTAMLSDDGCEDCIVCPLHNTAFALDSGEVRGEWCPEPPVIGKLMGSIKPQANLAKFDVRTKGKNVEVRINTMIEVNVTGDDKPKNQKT